jgi:hypothetical protein
MKPTLNLIAAGIAALQRKHAEGEGAKLGNLRVGGTGALAYGGKVIGTCMRQGYLRQQGIDVKNAGEDREHMFAGGRANEDIWEELFSAAAESIPGLSWKREEEFPVNSATSNGTRITGRPDFVLFHKGQPQRILELKLVSSLYTALDVGIALKPKLGHLLQAVHYSIRLGLPVELWYASRSDYHVPEFKKPAVPARSARVEYNWKKEAKKILPFLQGYAVNLTAQGQVTYRALPAGKETHTIITKEGILEYFEQQSKMKETDALPPKPSKIGLDGMEAHFSLCDYCVLKPTCVSYKGTSVKEWTSKVLAENADKVTKR